MKKKLNKTNYLKEIAIEKTNGKKKRLIIDMGKYPKLYDKLTELSFMNVRSIEQQALFYIMQAVGETEVEKKEDDKCK